MIIVTGDTETAIEEPAQTAAIALPAAEPTTEDKTTSDASAPQPNEEKAGEASTAIVVEVTQSSTVAVPGQPVEEEPVVTGSMTEPSPTTPVSTLDGKTATKTAEILKGAAGTEVPRRPFYVCAFVLLPDFHRGLDVMAGLDPAIPF